MEIVKVTEKIIAKKIKINKILCILEFSFSGNNLKKIWKKVFIFTITRKNIYFINTLILIKLLLIKLIRNILSILITYIINTIIFNLAKFSLIAKN